MSELENVPKRSRFRVPIREIKKSFGCDRERAHSTDRCTGSSVSLVCASPVTYFKTMGEPTTLAVHRCRFVDYTPSAITALAFPPLPLPKVIRKNSTLGKQPLKFGTLAVGHANGNIDLCEWTGGERELQSSQAWVARKVWPTSQLNEQC